MSKPVDVLAKWKPTPENRICRCVADEVCGYCALSAEIERLRATLAEIVQQDIQSDRSSVWVGPCGRLAKRALGIYAANEQRAP